MNVTALPSTGPAREALREKGQFWTPEWIADAMTGYALAGGASQLLDPAVGAGVFFRAALRHQPSCKLVGFDVDERILMEARACGLTARDLAGVKVADFLSHPHRGGYDAIVANPPYIRHHRLSETRKAELRRYAIGQMGFALDGRIGLHAYFLLKALELLRPGGRLAFILPADICEGISARPLWNWIAAKYRLDAVISFAPEAAPFPGVDTNALIFFIRADKPAPEFKWVRVLESAPAGFAEWLAEKPNGGAPDSVRVVRRQLDEAVRTGLSRPPFAPRSDGLCLRDFARVMRGIATGANEFFTLTNARRGELGLPEKLFRRVVGRTRDCPDAILTRSRLDELERKGRPTHLLSLGSEPVERFSPSLQTYLAEGERLGLSVRALISTRQPWYRMETRPVPPLLFAYLGRRTSRFILNEAGALPLTGFLCVYPEGAAARNPRLLWQALNHPATLAHLQFVGKSYGDGAIKVEPRALEQLVIPREVLDEFDLRPDSIERQQLLLEAAPEYGRRKKTNGESTPRKRKA